jgi:hypothetical protein
VVTQIDTHRKTVDDHRQRFKTAPHGRWSHAIGTFSNVMDELWEFNPDHTGSITHLGPFRGVHGETAFVWTEVEDFAIACKRTMWWYHHGAGIISMEEDDVEGEAWETIRYTFRLVPTDCGDVIGMYQVAPNGTLSVGFWQSTVPLMYHGAGE